MKKEISQLLIIWISLVPMKNLKKGVIRTFGILLFGSFIEYDLKGGGKCP
jgi:hypothetical protein